MSRFDTWLNTANRLPTWVGNKSRPASVTNIIADKPASIVIERMVNNVKSTLAAQTVRIDTLSGAKEAGILFDTGLISSQSLVILGYKGHPTIADTDMITGDRFLFSGRAYRVKKVEASFTDRLLAFAEEWQ